MVWIDSAALQARMLALGIGVMKLAELARLQPKTVSALHREDRRVRIATLFKLAQALKCLPMTLVKAQAAR